VREAYRFITTYGDQGDRSRVDNVWHRHIPAKVSLFVWRLLRDRLPTRDNLFRRNVIHAPDSLCGRLRGLGINTSPLSRMRYFIYVMDLCVDLVRLVFGDPL